MHKIFYILIFFLYAQLTWAKQYYFKADSYERGLHLMAGGGLNGSLYLSDSERQNQGIGLNGKTDLGYYFNNQFAWEISSNVKFNYVHEYLIWDTLLTTGLRYRFNKFPFTKSKGIYMRAFYGRAPTVFYLHNAPEVYRRSKADRLQYNGPVYGLALGNMYGSKNGNIWFIEYGLSYQKLGAATGIKNDGEVPQTLFMNSGDNIQIYSLYASIGVLVF